MRSSAYVDVGLVVSCVWDGGIVEQTQSAARGIARVMAGAQPGFAAVFVGDLETGGEELQDLEAEVMAVVGEGTEIGFVGGEGWW